LSIDQCNQRNLWSVIVGRLRVPLDTNGGRGTEEMIPVMHEYFEKSIQDIVDMRDEDFLSLCSDYLRLAELESLREERLRQAQQLTTDWRSQRENG